MSKYTVIIQPVARLELEDAYEYLESQKLTLGFDLLAEVSTILQILEDNPYIYQRIHGEKRRAVTRKFKYNIIYIIDGTEVIILSIMHGSRDPKRWHKD